MSEHPDATVVREMGEAMFSGDMERAAGLIADDVVWHAIGAPEPTRGKAALAASMGGFGGMDFSYDVHDILATDDHVVTLGTAHVTRGNDSIEYRTAEIYHVRDGKVTERWAFSDDTQAIIDFFG